MVITCSRCRAISRTPWLWLASSWGASSSSSLVPSYFIRRYRSYPWQIGSTQHCTHVCVCGGDVFEANCLQLLVQLWWRSLQAFKGSWRNVHAAEPSRLLLHQQAGLGTRQMCFYACARARSNLLWQGPTLYHHQSKHHQLPRTRHKTGRPLLCLSNGMHPLQQQQG